MELKDMLTQMAHKSAVASLDMYDKNPEIRPLFWDRKEAELALERIFNGELKDEVSKVIMNAYANYFTNDELKLMEDQFRQNREYIEKMAAFTSTWQCQSIIEKIKELALRF
jgi:transcription termination factor NusB